MSRTKKIILVFTAISSLWMLSGTLYILLFLTGQLIIPIEEPITNEKMIGALLGFFITPYIPITVCYLFYRRVDRHEKTPTNNQ